MKGRLILGLVVAVALLAGVVLPAGGVFAATSQNVTVTGAPSYIAITNTPNTWTINGLTGNGFILPNTAYYANNASDTTAPSATVLDAECRFIVTNVSSTIPLDLTVNFPHFTGGDAMQNSGDKATNGANTFAAASYCTGMTYSAASTAANSGSAVMKDEWTGTTLKWGLYIKTQTGDWGSGSVMSSTVTITATAD